MRLFSFLFFASVSLQSIYTSLNPQSVSQHFAFYELYPDTPLGKQALRHAWELLHGGSHAEQILPAVDIQSLVAFVNRPPQSTEAPALAPAQLATIEKLGRHLKNRALKGYGIWDTATLEALPSEQIDLARGLFLAEMEQDTEEARQKIRSYEAHLDLMALQILAHLPENPTAQDKVRVMNDFIFSELRFRFPPHSLHIKDIDVYTLLPSVIDSRRGVCLGVSILYLCLAQRLDVPLEIITPPGHIYVRYRDPQTQEIINIETTARGIDTPSEVYLSIEARKLQVRTMREVIGLAFFNQASVTWRRGEIDTTIRLYERGRPFLPDDYLLNMFLGFQYLFAGRTEEGDALLKKINGVIPDHMVSSDTVSEDYLAGHTNAAGIQAIYSEVDETRASILAKQKKLEEIVAAFPSFRAALFHLAITHLQLGREKQALPLLERYHALHPADPTASYYLSVIHFQRFNLNQAWKYLQKTEAILFAKDHHPRALKELRDALQQASPCPKILSGEKPV